MHSYNFARLLGSIETIQIVQNSGFVVFSTMDSLFDVPYKIYNVLQWDLNQEDETEHHNSKCLFTGHMLRVANFYSVVAIPGKYFIILFHVAISIAEGLVEQLKDNWLKCFERGKSDYTKRKATAKLSCPTFAEAFQRSTVDWAKIS